MKTGTGLVDYAINHAAPAKSDVPKDWRPSVEFKGDLGSATIEAPHELTGADADIERVLLLGAGCDPDRHMIRDGIHYRKYMRDVRTKYYKGKEIPGTSDLDPWMHYYKFDIVRLSAKASEFRQQTAAELAKFIRAPKRHSVPAGSDLDAFAVVFADWQVGKGERDGTQGTVTRVSDAIDLSVRRVKELRRIGRRMPVGSILSVGDLVEGTCGFYSNQSYLIDMNDREQSRVAGQLVTYGIEQLSPLFDDFLIATSLDNHGQKRNSSDGKVTTDLSDNKTAEVFDNVYTAFQRDARYSNLRWVIPNDETSVLVELGGVPVGLTHGDLFYGGGKLPQMKAYEWWKSQDFGMQTLRGAKLLLSGHFHHNSEVTYGSRTHFQAPAMDPGSLWFANSSGMESPPGMLTLRLDGELVYGWADKAILLG